MSADLRPSSEHTPAIKRHGHHYESFGEMIPENSGIHSLMSPYMCYSSPLRLSGLLVGRTIGRANGCVGAWFVCSFSCLSLFLFVSPARFVCPAAGELFGLAINRSIPRSVHPVCALGSRRQISSQYSIQWRNDTEVHRCSGTFDINSAKKNSSTITEFLRFRPL